LHEAMSGAAEALRRCPPGRSENASSARFRDRNREERDMKNMPAQKRAAYRTRPAALLGLALAAGACGSAPCGPNERSREVLFIHAGGICDATLVVMGACTQPSGCHDSATPCGCATYLSFITGDEGDVCTAELALPDGTKLSKSIELHRHENMCGVDDRLDDTIEFP
jgi:hypothetical protein